MTNESAGASSCNNFQSARERHYSFYLGYTGNFKNTNRDKEKNNKYNHIIEAGFAYTRQFPSNFGYSLYLGSDFVFNSSNFLIGPKAGVTANYSIVMLGSEIISYTDFNFATMYYRPYVGVGIVPIKLTAGYNFEVVNRGTFSKKINSFTVGVTLPLFWGK